MPPVAVWFVRAALCHLALGVTVGAALLAAKGLPALSGVAPLRPAHVEFLLVGWTMQLVMGVAIWIFPRMRLSGPPHGRPETAWAAFTLLNAGVWLVALSPWLPAGGALGGRMLEVAAAGAFVATLWRRVRSGLSQI